MKLQKSKSEIIYHFGDTEEALKKLKQDLPNSSLTKRLEINQRNQKIRGYLEKRFYKQLTAGNKNVSPLIIEIYKKANGDPKFFEC
jgi:hypothetical protein